MMNALRGGLAGALALLGIGGIGPAHAAAPRYTILDRLSDTAPGGDSGAIAVDVTGAIYGVVEFGKAGGYVFRTAHRPPPGVGWSFEVLQTFEPVETPAVGLAIGQDGSVYGTRAGSFCAGGADSVAWRLQPPATPSQTWQYSEIHDFTPDDPAGTDPNVPLVIDRNGVLYGVTQNHCGRPDGKASVFSLTPPSAGQTGWTETVLHQFNGTPPSGNVLGPLALTPDQSAMFAIRYNWNSSQVQILKLQRVGAGWDTSTVYGPVLTSAAGVFSSPIARSGGEVLALGTAWAANAPESLVQFASSDAGNRWATSVLYAFPPTGTGASYCTYGNAVRAPSGSFFMIQFCDYGDQLSAVELDPPAPPASTAWTLTELHALDGDKPGTIAQPGHYYGFDLKLAPGGNLAGILINDVEGLVFRQEIYNHATKP